MKWFESADNQRKFLIYYCLIAGLSFFSTLFLPHIGEEAVYSLGTLEMLSHKQYLVHTLLNHPYSRPPFYIWLIAAVTKIIGWQQVLLAARLVVALTTLLTSYLLFLFTQKIFKQQILALFTVAIYLSGDLLFRRGWLAYADPTFSLFVFISIACLWLALDSKRYNFLIYAILATTAAFLTKALTVYVFYAVAALVFLWRHPNGKWLLTPYSIFLHILGIALPSIWLIAINPADQGMLNDILLTAGTPATASQHIAHIFIQPLHLIGLFAPLSLIAIYLAIRKRIVYQDLPKNIMIMLLLIVFINYLPYWIAIKGEDPRYILPLYPFFAILLANLIIAGKGLKISCYWLLVTLALKLLAGCWGFYYFQEHNRSNYQQLAQTILKTVKNYPIYSNDVEFTGLSTVAELEILQGPNYPTIGLPPAISQNAYLISVKPIQPGYQLFKHYPLKRTDLYLLCKGKAC